MSVRSDILEDVLAWLQGVNTASGYQTDVAEARRGIHLPDDMPNRPAVSFWNDLTRRRDRVAGMKEGWLHLFVWGFIDVQPGIYTDLDAFAADVEKMFATSRPNWRQGVEEVRVGDMTIYEGGADTGRGSFEMEVEITYCYAAATP